MMGVTHGVSAAQAVLRWNVQRGVVVIPKSVTPARIAANGDLFAFHLDAEDMAAMVRCCNLKPVLKSPGFCSCH